MFPGSRGDIAFNASLDETQRGIQPSLSVLLDILLEKGLPLFMGHLEQAAFQRKRGYKSLSLFEKEKRLLFLAEQKLKTES